MEKNGKTCLKLLTSIGIQWMIIELLAVTTPFWTQSGISRDVFFGEVGKVCPRSGSVAEAFPGAQPKHLSTFEGWSGCLAFLVSASNGIHKLGRKQLGPKKRGFLKLCIFFEVPTVR